MPSAIHPHVLDTDFPAIRRAMGPDRLLLSDPALEQLIERVFPDTDPSDVEDFMQTVQRFGKDAAPLAQRALPGVIQGATTGASVGGPWGALAGGVIGGVGSLAGGAPKGPTATNPPSARVGGTAEPGVVGSSALPATGQAAIAQLLALLSRPETMQALAALLMPGIGRPTIPLGNAQVPPAAFANAIAELASVGAMDVETVPDAAEHLYDNHGVPRGDLANPSARAAILLSDVASVSLREMRGAHDASDDDYEESDDVESDWAEDEPETDALDAYESARRGEFR